MKRILSILLVILLILLLCSCGNTNQESTQPQNTDSQESTSTDKIDTSFTPIKTHIGAGSSATAALLSDGTVVCSLDNGVDHNVEAHSEWEQWTNIDTISMNEEILAGVTKDGKVVWCGGRTLEYDWLTDKEVMGVIDTWNNIVQVSAGPFDIAALTKDGSIEITGSIWTEDLEEKDGFTNIAVYDALFCVRRDGTVYCYAPATYEGQTWEYDVSNWKDIKQVSAGYDHAAALKTDGTVVATGNNEKGQCDTESWTDIIQVYAGREHTIGLKSDGTVVFCGEPPFGGFDSNFLSGWTDIVEVAGFFDTYMGLKKDGTIVYAGPDDRYYPVNVSNINK